MRDIERENEPKSILDEAIELHQSQVAKGIKKYGHPLDIGGLSLADALRYGEEEMADWIHYSIDARRKLSAMMEGHAAEVARLTARAELAEAAAHAEEGR